MEGKIFEQIIQTRNLQQLEEIENAIKLLTQQIKALQQQKYYLTDERKALQHTIETHKEAIKKFLLQSEILPYIRSYSKISIINIPDDIIVKITPTKEQREILRKKKKSPSIQQSST